MNIVKSAKLAALAAGLAVAGLTGGCVVEPLPAPQRQVIVHETAPAVQPDVIYMDEARPGVVHDYYYYPDDQVYYDPISVSFFWSEGGSWHHGRRLPPYVHIHEQSRYRFRSDAPHPYDAHRRVVERYHGRPDDRRMDDRRGMDGNRMDNRRIEDRRTDDRRMDNGRQMDNRRKDDRRMDNGRQMDNRRMDNDRRVEGRPMNDGRNHSPQTGRPGGSPPPVPIH